MDVGAEIFDGGVARTVIPCLTHARCHDAQPGIRFQTIPVPPLTCGLGSIPPPVTAIDLRAYLAPPFPTQVLAQARASLAKLFAFAASLAFAQMFTNL